MKNIFAISTIIPILSLKEMTPKLCINCKFYISDSFKGTEYGRCSLFKRKGMDNDSGKDSFLFCLTARTYEELCGKEGKKYVNKPDNKIVLHLEDLK
jgi:hypothetical protein